MTKYNLIDGMSDRVLSTHWSLPALARAERAVQPKEQNSYLPTRVERVDGKPLDDDEIDAIDRARDELAFGR